MGLLWDRFDVGLGSLGSVWDRFLVWDLFGMIGLGSVWDRFEIGLRQVCDRFGIFLGSV